MSQVKKIKKNKHKNHNSSYSYDNFYYYDTNENHGKDKIIRDIHSRDINIDYTEEYDSQKIEQSCIPEHIKKLINEGRARLKDIHRLNMHTYRNPDPQYDTFYNILDDNFKRMKYESGSSYKSGIHIGQLKLLLSEIRIIEHGLYELWGEGRLSMNGNKFAECDRPVVVIAPGGAAGYHFTQLCKLLPKLKFELIDPNPFDRELIKYSQISTHRKFFTDETAEFYKNKYGKNHVIIIISDIRSADYRVSSANKVEEDVERDMKMQDRWFRIINPDFCIYKFRTAYIFKDKFGKTNKTNTNSFNNTNSENELDNGIKKNSNYAFDDNINDVEYNSDSEDISDLEYNSDSEDISDDEFLRTDMRSNEVTNMYIPSYDKYNTDHIEKSNSTNYIGLNGLLWFQLLPGDTSTELRLYAKKDCDYKEYDALQIEEACYYHNQISRNNIFIHGYEGLYGLDSCYDCAGVIECLSFHISLVKQKFPHVSRRFTNVKQLLDWLMPTYIHRQKTVKFNGVLLLTTFNKSNLCKLTNQERKINEHFEFTLKPICNEVINLAE